MSDDIVQDAKSEISGMAKQGVRHPSTKPVLGGLAAGAVIGGGLMFYKRLRP